MFAGSSRLSRERGRFAEMFAGSSRLSRERGRFAEMFAGSSRLSGDRDRFAEMFAFTEEQDKDIRTCIYIHCFYRHRCGRNRSISTSCFIAVYVCVLL